MKTQANEFRLFFGWPMSVTDLTDLREDRSLFIITLYFSNSKTRNRMQSCSLIVSFKICARKHNMHAIRYHALSQMLAWFELCR